MKMYYYRGPRPNFGDALNAWLWPRLLPDFFDNDESALFLGIGSILYDFFPPAARKVVFGAGYGGYTSVPHIDERWAFYFVRGPLTARRLGLDPSLAIGDGAILVRSCVPLRPRKVHRASFMPHWESAMDGDWSTVSSRAGLHYIDPSGDVDRVIADILDSEMVVTEAMHGAIVADALRVPWVPVRPVQSPNRGKWFDWAAALGIELRPQPLAPSNALESAVSLTAGSKPRVRALRTRWQRLRPLGRGVFHRRAVKTLLAASNGPLHLSTRSAIEQAHARMLEQLDRLRRDFH
jgi:exopolysaccharide glucosyl ketal-pyruvate-transferase